MDKRRNHIIFWVGYAVVYFVSMFIAYKDFSNFYMFITRTVFFYFGLLSSFYLFVKIIFPNTLSQKKYFLLFIIVLILLFVLFFINYFSTIYLSVNYSKYISKPIILTSLARSSMVIERTLYLAIPFWFFNNCVKEMKQNLAHEKKNNSLKKSVLNAELFGLKNQINPHFFYNILNFLYAQSLPINPKISSAILTLSDMMRYAIRENDEEGKVPLEKEVSYIQNYILLENLQNSKNQSSRLNIIGNPKYRRVTPLTLQPILEICYKYGYDIIFTLNTEENQIHFYSNFKVIKGIENINTILDIVKSKIQNNKGCFLSIECNELNLSYLLHLNIKS